MFEETKILWLIMLEDGKEVYLPGQKSIEILWIILGNLLEIALEEHIAMLNSTYCLDLWLILCPLSPNLD